MCGIRRIFLASEIILITVKMPLFRSLNWKEAKAKSHWMRFVRRALSSRRVSCSNSLRSVKVCIKKWAIWKQCQLPTKKRSEPAWALSISFPQSATIWTARRTLWRKMIGIWATWLSRWNSTATIAQEALSAQAPRYSPATPSKSTTTNTRCVRLRVWGRSSRNRFNMAMPSMDFWKTNHSILAVNWSSRYIQMGQSTMGQGRKS